MKKQRLKVIQFLSSRTRIQIQIFLILRSELFQSCIEKRQIVVISGRWDHNSPPPPTPLRGRCRKGKDKEGEGNG